MSQQQAVYMKTMQVQLQDMTKEGKKPAMQLMKC